MRLALRALEVELECPFPENLEIIVGEVAQDGRIVHAPGFRTFIQQIVQTGTGRQVIRFKIPDYIQAYGEASYRPRPAGTDGEIAPFRYAEVNRHYGPVTVRRTAYYTISSSRLPSAETLISVLTLTMTRSGLYSA